MNSCLVFECIHFRTRNKVTLEVPSDKALLAIIAKPARPTAVKFGHIQNLPDIFLLILLLSNFLLSLN